MNPQFQIHTRHVNYFLYALAATIHSFLVTTPIRADEPFARTRDYDLQHSKISLSFDLQQKKVIGDVVHSLVILCENTSKISFDSVGLKIESVTLNKAAAKFKATSDKLNIPLPAAAKIGDKFEIEIKYQGRPNRSEE